MQFSTTGSAWNNLDGTKTLTNQDFTQLQLRTKSGFTSTKTSILTFVAVTTGGLTFGAKTLTFTSTISDVSLSLSANQTETLEEGESGTEKTFTITQAGLSSISVTTDETSQYHVSKTTGTGLRNRDKFTGTDLNSSSVSVYVKLITEIGTTAKNATITATGTPSNGSTDISDTATLTSNVAPRPVINSITINQSNLDSGSISASITTSNIDGYDAHHWHYTISDGGGDIGTSTNKMVNAGGVGGYGPATIDDVNVLNNPDDYTITAWIVNNVGGHAKVSADPDETQTFTIQPNIATMGVSNNAIDEDIDVDDSPTSHTINITSKNNITDVSLSALTNWDATLNGAKNQITITLKDSAKQLDSGSAKDIAQETLTVTGTIGLRHNTEDAELTSTISLDATIYDDAEFLITGSKTIADNRVYGVVATERSLSVSKNKNVTYTVTGTLNNWRVAVDEGGYGDDLLVLQGMVAGTTFKFKHTGTNAETYAQETITFTPTPTAADGDKGASAPNNVVITLNSTISPGVATLTDPGSLTLVAVNSGGTPASKTFTVAGDNIENIVLEQATDNFTVSANGPVVTYDYEGSTTNIGTRNGTFNLTADAETNYKFAGNASSKTISVDLSLVVNPLVDAVASGCNSPDPINIDVDATSGNSGTCTVSATNASFVAPTSPKGDFNVELSGNTLTYSITDITSVDASASANFNLVANADTNHAFDNSGATTKNIPVTLTGSVVGLATSLGVTPDSAIALGDVVQNASTTGTEITIDDADNLASATISVSGGGFEIIETPQPAAANGGYGTSDVTITDPLNKTFWIKFNSTGNTGGANSTVTVSGTKSAKGASNPADVTIDCTATITVDAGGGGGADDCTACRGSSVAFDFSVDTIGLGVPITGHGAAGVGISGGEFDPVTNGMAAGSLCFFGISGTTNPKAMPTNTFVLANGNMATFQFDMNNTIIDGRVVYRASDGTFWGGTMNADGGEFTMTEITDCIGGGDGGDAQATGCATCDTDISFDFSVDTIGLGVPITGHGAAGVGISGGEFDPVTNGMAAGSLCFFGISGTTNPKAMPTNTFVLANGNMATFQFDMNNTIIDGRVVYLASDGSCWSGTMNADGGEFTMTQI